MKGRLGHRVWARIVTMSGLALLLGLAACQSFEIPDDWEVVRRDDLVLGVDVTGVLEAVDSDGLGPPPVPELWDFKIARMAPEGQEVEAGAPVLMFDTSELVRKLEQKQNERDAAAKELEKQRHDIAMARRDQELALAEARARLRKAELVVERPEELTAAVDLTRARLDLELAQKDVAFHERKTKATRRRDQAVVAELRDKHGRAEQRVREYQDYIARMAMSASRAGTVIYTSNWRGEKKKVGDSAWRAERVLEVASLDKMKATGDVDEMDGSKVAVGQRVSLRLDAHPDVEFWGKVASIGDSVQRKSEDMPAKVVKLDIALDRTEPRRMRPGMRYRGTVETERIEGVVIIATDAVFITEGGPVAYRRKGDDYETVRLTLGRRNQEYVEVVEGLAEGDRISRTDLARAGATGGSP
jgi:multidrug efflux pump subunit AcrA (membrane-fusion protein)